MDRSFVFTCAALLVSLASAQIDHDVYFNCSRVEFCSEFRNREPENKYTINPDGNVYGENSATFTLTPNDDSNPLKLEVFALENDVIRVKIAEVDSTRYELVDVLDGEPKSVPFTSTDTMEDHYEAHTETASIRVVYDPLRVELYQNEILEIVLDGENLVVENTDTSRAFAFKVFFPEAVQMHGLHQHAGNLALDSTVGMEPYRIRNLDVGGYDLYSPMAIYGGVPVLYARSTSVTAGIFLHNAAQQWYDLANGENVTSAHVMTESGTLDIFALLGPTPADVVRQYTGLTGTAHLPQMWALGYHQCRYNYDNQSDVKDVIANMDKANFPMDVIWLDIEYTDGKRYFTWNPENFSDPLEMQQNISSTNRKLVTIIDPHVKVEPGYVVYDVANENGFFIKNPDGSNFEGDCWPGRSSWMDFLNPEARSFYSSMYSYENFPDSTETLAGIWNDMNEPSVFDDTTERTVPSDCLHVGGVEHRDVHNTFGLLNAMATHDGMLQRDNGTKRPFVLTRSTFAGSQRYAAFWLGDTHTSWIQLTISIPMCLTANLVGLVLCGGDLGGFFGNPTDEIVQRWYQAGAWLPFFRQHADLHTRRREPYLFSEEAQAGMRSAMQTRYAHLPQWYTLFFEHTRTGDPLIRPLFYHYPSDPNALTIDNEFLVGRDILIKPVTVYDASNVEVYFPGGAEEYWISILTSEAFSGGYYSRAFDIQTYGLYYRAGGVVVRKDTVRPSTVDMLQDPYSIYAVLDSANKSQGTVYIDDLTSFRYRDNMEYLYLNIAIDNLDVTLTYIDEDAIPTGFEFNVEHVYLYYVTPDPVSDTGLSYNKVHYTRDDSGKPLKDLKFDFGPNNEYSFSL